MAGRLLKKHWLNAAPPPMRETHVQTQEAQPVPIRWTQEVHTKTHYKWQKLKTRKAVREKQIRDSTHKTISRFLSRNITGQEEVAQSIPGAEKGWGLGWEGAADHVPGKAVLQNWKTFPDKQKLQEFISTR